MTNEEILAQAAGTDSQAQQPTSSPGIVAGSGESCPKTFLQILEEEMNRRNQSYQAEIAFLARGGSDPRGREMLKKILGSRRM